MDPEQMRERCPSTCFVCVARLPDHRLAFTRKSTRRNCGVADAVEAEGNEVWGVVYEIDDHDLPKLDRLEGVTSGAYVRRDGELLCILDNGDIQASIYFATRDKDPPLPNPEYKRLILSGARFWQLPQLYLDQLERIETEE
jgi:gamma-glutamylcyclotransferase